MKKSKILSIFLLFIGLTSSISFIILTFIGVIDETMVVNPISNSLTGFGYGFIVSCIIMAIGGGSLLAIISVEKHEKNFKDLNMHIK